MKAKRRYIAQNVFHARTLPGLGNARITRLAAPGDAIPCAASRISIPPHRLSAHTAPALVGRAANCQLAALDGHAGNRARTPGNRRAWPSQRIPRSPGQAPPRSAPSCTLPCAGNRSRRPRARCTPRAPWSPRPRATRRLRGFRRLAGKRVAAAFAPHAAHGSRGHERTNHLLEVFQRDVFLFGHFAQGEPSRRGLAGQCGS